MKASCSVGILLHSHIEYPKQQGRKNTTTNGQQPRQPQHGPPTEQPTESLNQHHDTELATKQYGEAPETNHIH
jgi:hypothetical protein